MAQVNLPPGFVLVEDAPATGLPPGFELMAAPHEAPPQGSGGASAALGALRSTPYAARSLAGFAAKHPAATQKVIGAGISTAAGATGAAVGGVPGAVVGASIRGVTPAQTVIRETAGRMSGEAPAVARDAARALGIQNYAKETTGLRLKPSDIINKPNAANALEHYANANEKGILRLYGPSGEVVSGPSAVSRIPAKAAPGMLRTAGGAIGRGLSRLSGPVAMMDFAKTVDPDRGDHGDYFPGVGASRPDPSGDELAQLNTKNTQAMQTRLAEQARQQAAVRARILALFGQ